MDTDLHSWAHFSNWLIGINFDSKDDYVTRVRKVVKAYRNIGQDSWNLVIYKT